MITSANLGCRASGCRWAWAFGREVMGVGRGVRCVQDDANAGVGGTFQVKARTIQMLGRRGVLFGRIDDPFYIYIGWM